MKIEVHPDLRALDEGRWNGLLDRSRLPSVFLTWQWQTEWSLAFTADRPKQILAATDTAGELAGLLPLYEDGPGRERIVGGVDVSDYLDLIAPDGREEEVWATLLQHCATRTAAWDLHGIRAASPSATLVPALAPACGLTPSVEREDRCPVLALPKTWDEYLARLSGKDRHELRRKIRRLERELPGATTRSHGEADGWDEAAGRGGLGAALVPRVRGRGGGRVPLPRVRRQRRPLQLGLRSRAGGARPRHRAAGPRHPRRDRPRLSGLRFPARRGALQVRLRPLAGGRAQREGDPVNLSVAMLSVHTCPLAALGGKETGGMNVYVRQVARELGRMGLQVDVFTRSQNPTIPRVVELGPGARVVHLPAGPEAPMPREAIHPHLDQFAAGVEDFARESGIAYDLIHSHYWLSGVAGLRLREKWGAPLVQMFHTLGRLKNAVAQSPPELEPALRP